ncbi:tRNA-splicing endonuclease-like protein subunit Sen2 [Ophiobolus disseminans]|uniref:tRNA-splicing endonuclease subunit Sen2 n=1 Tax=Ophiobolus disseminans TaxID=1469910 RepID=A0A6A7A261_9PLEO|nr:tRNA-splicing endonuclease-like protein subunit Sen2 [Ophiobolus disseminans]
MVVDLEAQTPAQAAQPNGVSTQPEEKPANQAPRKPRPRRPNFNEIHAKPIPLNVYPLPAFIPHNPISIVRIAISLLSHSLFPPKSHTVVHRAYFSPETQSIHVTDPASVRALWEQGFWGKGSLSRSEPQWLVGEKKRRGVTESKTSAEVTQNRREERKQFKLERARAQREAIEQQLRQEGKLEADGSIEELVEDGEVAESPRGTLYTPSAGDELTLNGDSIASEISKSLAKNPPTWGEDDAAPEEDVEIVDQEHMQLTPEEAFYLTYTLGALSVVSDSENTGEPCPTWYLLRLYAAHASFPVPETVTQQLRNALQLREHGSDNSALASSIPSIQPDNQFILRYIVYHHFRSLGWVVRPGIKFAVDYLLYMRGPAFHHAEFAIMIIPSYSDASWSSAPEHESRKSELAKKDWWWLHRVNRVQSAVFKTLVLVYVEVPPPWDGQDEWKVDIGNVLKKYTVREVVVRRWSPNRNRD